MVKFGGASIADGERVKRAASSVARECKKGTRVLVVASAMGDTTDELVETARISTEGRVSAIELDDIMAMGELTAVRIFAAALRSQGVNARYIDPLHEEWPVVTSDEFGGARVDLAKTKRRTKRYILPLLERGVVPVICGFLGRDPKGRMTTIGRGGSDITAFLLANCVGADEAVLVKDVDGVMSADPDTIKNARPIERISVEEMRDLAMFGAKVLHLRALQYKHRKIETRIVHFRHGSLSAPGTTITGAGGERVDRVWLHKKPLSMLTVIGEGMQTTSGILAEVTRPLGEANVNILGVSIGPRSFSIYVSEEDERRAVELVHEKVVKHKLMKSVTSERGIAMLVAESERFIETPGVIAELTKPLARSKINIIEIFSSRASISFFVNWADGQRTLELLKEAMGLRA